MSTPDQPDTPQLTRRQLRELRNTASTPIITPEEAEAAAAASVVAPLPRAAEPTVVAEEPPAAEDVDLDSPALTRRAARQQERLRTASVPVIESVPEAESPDDALPADDDAETVDAQLDDAEAVTPESGDAADGEDAEHEADMHEAGTEDGDDAGAAPSPESEAETPITEDDVADAADALEEAQSEAPDVEISDEQRPVVAPTFGSELLAGESVELELPASFDQLLSRNTASAPSLTASNALILSQTPEGALTAPVTATGEVLITGTFNLPESFGSTGTARGSSDGKEIDAILVDGELPPASSPTPIAASSAISTIKSAEDIIKPPAPEKGSRLMLVLGITAGALALALVGVLIVAMFTGAFQ